MPPQFHPLAQEELRRAARSYEQAQEGLGFRFTRAVRAAMSRVELNPDLFRIVSEDVRKCRVLRFPYGILFRHRRDGIYIVAVMHLHRDPSYWKDRL
jgi:toxin ParE1/3/4